MLDVLQQVANGLGESSNFPVSKLNLRVLSVKFTAARCFVLLDGECADFGLGDFLLGHADFLQSLVLSSTLFSCTASSSHSFLMFVK